MISTILTFLTDIGKLFILIYGIFKIKLGKKCWKIPVIIIGNIGILLLFCTVKVSGDSVTYFAPVLAILTITILSDSWKRIFIILPSYLCISFCDMLGGGIVALIMKKNVEELLNSPILLQLCNSIVLVTLFILYLVFRKKKQLKFTVYQINYSLLGILTLGLVGALFYIAPLQVMTIDANEFKYRNEVIFGITLSGIILLIIYTTLIVIYYKNHYYKVNLLMSETLLKSQKNYYQSILEKEEDTKKFRHDINHHINCLLRLQIEEQYDDLREYLLSMGSGINQIKRGIDTGNELINIIVEDICSNYADSKININWKGIFPEKTKFTNMDICILLSNILKNAFEAELKWKENAKRESVHKEYEIFVDIKNINRALYIRVMNDTGTSGKISRNQIIHTTKADKENHGYGTIIIKDMIDKYGGILTYSCKEHLFTTEILFNNIIK